MKKNMGSTDRIIRLLISAVLIILFALQVVSGILGYVLLAVAAIFILTSIVGFCPLYAIFGLKTTAAKK